MNLKDNSPAVTGHRKPVFPVYPTHILVRVQAATGRGPETEAPNMEKCVWWSREANGYLGTNSVLLPLEGSMHI